MPAYIRYRKLKVVRRESTSFACVAFSFTRVMAGGTWGEHGSGVTLVAGGGVHGSTAEEDFFTYTSSSVRQELFKNRPVEHDTEDL